jgi:GGDEF domain-containing protein
MPTSSALKNDELVPTRTESHERSHAPAPITLLRVAIDELEFLRACFGRLAVDGARRVVAESIAREVAPADQIIQRNGEFGVVMMSAELPEAMELAQRIRKRLRKLTLSTRSQRVVLTPRMGAATVFELRTGGNPFDGLWGLAGERLTRAE